MVCRPSSIVNCGKLRLFLWLVGMVILCQTGSSLANLSKEGPQRIISLAPGITEILFALDLGESIVGVTDFCNYPEAAKEKVKVGGLIHPNIELILSLKPDLVMMLPTHRDFKEKLETFHISTLTVPHERLSDIFESLEMIGEATKRAEKARKLIEKIIEGIEQVKRKVGEARRKTVLFVVERTPGTLQDIYAAGAGTFVEELITLAGGTNILSDAPTRYPKISKEVIIARNPEVILDSSLAPDQPEAKLKEVKEVWSILSSLSAVKGGKLFPVAERYVTIPGPRVIKGLEYIARRIHPELYDSP